MVLQDEQEFFSTNVVIMEIAGVITFIFSALDNKVKLGIYLNPV